MQVNELTRPMIFDLRKRGSLGLYEAIEHCVNTVIKSKGNLPSMLIMHSSLYYDLFKEIVTESDFTQGAPVFINSYMQSPKINILSAELKIVRTQDVPTPETIYLI